MEVVEGEMKTDVAGNTQPDQLISMERETELMILNDDLLSKRQY